MHMVPVDVYLVCCTISSCVIVLLYHSYSLCTVKFVGIFLFILLDKKVKYGLVLVILVRAESI